MDVLQARIAKLEAELDEYKAQLRNAMNDKNESEIEGWRNLVNNTTALLTEKERQLAG